jgi:transcriptional regulator with XRE-family HTH domain
MRAIEPDHAVRALGRRVAEIRVRRNRTQEEFAEDLDVSLKYVQRIEAGRANLSVRSLVRVANALHVPLKEFFSKPRSMSVRRGRPSKKT